MSNILLSLFFFKQKTAYEMRISDWSSDVCSSDLIAFTTFRKTKGKRSYFRAVRRSKDPTVFTVLFEDSAAMLGMVVAFVGIALGEALDIPVLDGEIGRASCRERVWQYVYISVVYVFIKTNIHIYFITYFFT